MNADDKLIAALPVDAKGNIGRALTEAELAIVDTLDRHEAMHSAEAGALEWLDARITAHERSTWDRLRDWWRIKRRAVRGWLAGRRPVP